MEQLGEQNRKLEEGYTRLQAALQEEREKRARLKAETAKQLKELKKNKRM